VCLVGGGGVGGGGGGWGGGGGGGGGGGPPPPPPSKSTVGKARVGLEDKLSPVAFSPHWQFHHFQIGGRHRIPRPRIVPFSTAVCVCVPKPHDVVTVMVHKDQVCLLQILQPQNLYGDREYKELHLAEPPEVRVEQKLARPRNYCVRTATFVVNAAISTTRISYFSELLLRVLNCTSPIRTSP